MRFKQVLKKRLNEAGSSLIETMIAMTCLSTGLLAVGQMVPAGLIGVSDARVRTMAIQAAQQKLEDIRSADYGDSELAAGTYSETIGRYGIQWTVVDNAPVPGVKRIQIVASWLTARGTKTTTLTTHVTPK